MKSPRGDLLQETSSTHYVLAGVHRADCQPHTIYRACRVIMRIEITASLFAAILRFQLDVACRQFREVGIPISHRPIVLERPALVFE